MENEFLGQALSILAVLITFISYQARGKRTILIIHSTSIICICLSYLFLGAISGFVLNVICFMRNIAYCLPISGKKANFALTLFFTAVMIAVGVFSWQDIFSLFIIVALAINTFVMGAGTPQQLRKSILLTSTLVIIYNSIVFNLGGIINEIIAITSSIIGIIRFRERACDDRANAPKT